MHERITTEYKSIRRYLTMPIGIRLCMNKGKDKLTATDKLTYSVIHSYSQAGRRECTASNISIGEQIGVKVSAIKNALSKLERLKLIERSYKLIKHKNEPPRTERTIKLNLRTLAEYNYSIDENSDLIDTLEYYNTGHCPFFIMQGKFNPYHCTKDYSRYRLTNFAKVLFFELYASFYAYEDSRKYWSFYKAKTKSFYRRRNNGRYSKSHHQALALKKEEQLRQRRASTSYLSEVLGVSESTIDKSLKMLQDAGHIQIYTYLNTGSIGGRVREFEILSLIEMPDYGYN